MTEMMDYNDVIGDLVEFGAPSEPRGLKTTEMVDFRISTLAGNYPYRTRMNRKLAYLEGLMLVGGIFDLDLIRQVAPNANIKLYEKQSDYGIRVRNQVPIIIEELRNDIESRRAVIQFNGTLHLGTDNVACTLGAQFLVRQKKFYSHFFMRSWDAVLGLPNDVVMFGMLSQAIERCVVKCLHNIITVTAGSFHLYESNRHLAVATGQRIFRLNDNWPTTWPEIRQKAEWLARNHETWGTVPTDIIEDEGNLFEVG